MVSGQNKWETLFPEGHALSVSSRSDLCLRHRFVWLLTR